MTTTPPTRERVDALTDDGGAAMTPADDARALTDDERRAERRGAEKFKEKLDRAGFTGKEYRAIEDAFNELYPPPEPERVWVKLSYGTEHTRDPDGKWWYRFGNGRQVYEYAVTDADIRALASLVPGLVAQPLEPTAWLLSQGKHHQSHNTYEGRCPSLENAIIP